MDKIKTAYCLQFYKFIPDSVHTISISTCTVNYVICITLQDDGSSVNVHINLQATTQVSVFGQDKIIYSHSSNTK